MSDILESCILCTIWICTLNFGKKHGVHIDIIWHYIALCDGTVYFFRIFSGVTISDPSSTQHHEEYVYYQRPNIGCLPGKPACWVVEYDFCPWTAQHDDWSKFDNIKNWKYTWIVWGSILKRWCVHGNMTYTKICSLRFFLDKNKRWRIGTIYVEKDPVGL